MDVDEKAPRTGPVPRTDTIKEGLDPETGLPAYELVTPRPPLRVTGPGRRERAYLERIEHLESDLKSGQREVECMQLVERGTQRLLDRMEHDADRARDELAEQRKLERRLVLTLGALQRENELLRSQLESLPGGEEVRRLTASADAGSVRSPKGNSAERRSSRQSGRRPFLQRLFRRET